MYLYLFLGIVILWSLSKCCDNKNEINNLLQNYPKCNESYLALNSLLLSNINNSDISTDDMKIIISDIIDKYYSIKNLVNIPDLDEELHQLMNCDIITPNMYQKALSKIYLDLYIY